MRILAFAGSLRKESLNKKLVLQAAEVLRAAGHSVDFLDLNGYHFPSYDADLETSGQWPSDLETFRKQILDHDALVISSPEYNHSMPGHFKNTFDWVSRLRPIPWKGKPVLLMSASPSLVGGARALQALLGPFEACGSYVFPDLLSVSSAHKAFDADGGLSDPKVLERLRETASRFVTFALALRHQEL